MKPLGLGWPNIVSALPVLLVPLLVWLIVLDAPYLLPVGGVAGLRLAVLIVAVPVTVYSGLDHFIRMRPSRLERLEKS